MQLSNKLIENIIKFTSILCIVVGCPLAYGMAFTPIENQFSPSGRSATQIFLLENNTSESIAVELYAKKRAMAENGDDQLTDAEDQFNIFPAQVVLEPGKSQSVRVQYVGSSEITSEQAFRLVAEQLPIDIGQAPSDGGHVRLLAKYIASIYVTPENVKPILTVLEAKIVNDAGRKWLEVKIQNDGSKHKVLKNAKLTFGNQSFSSDSIKGIDSENILAKTARLFRISAPEALNSISGNSEIHSE